MAPWLIPEGVEAAVAAGEGAADVAVGAAEAGSDIAIGMGDAAETSASLIARGVVKRLAPKVVKELDSKTGIVNKVKIYHRYISKDGKEKYDSISTFTGQALKQYLKDEAHGEAVKQAFDSVVALGKTEKKIAAGIGLVGGAATTEAFNVFLNKAKKDKSN